MVILRICLITAGLWTALLPRSAASEPMSAEAERLWRSAQRDAPHPHGAVQLIRLMDFADWMPKQWLEQRLNTAANDANRHPLSRGIAHWLMRTLALDRLNPTAALHAMKQLGLQTNFVYRAGRAPPPRQPLDKKAWRQYPSEMGYGVLWLDSLLRPHRQAWATLVSDVYADATRPAVLRMGYDDKIRVWLNGIEVYSSTQSRGAWLDQTAVPVYLRAGVNRLMVEVYQKSNAWRFCLRVTDGEGHALNVQSRAQPWGPVPDPATGPLQAPPAYLWTILNDRAIAELSPDQSVRDLADYARVTRLPIGLRRNIQNMLEARWRQSASPQTLRAWLRLADGKSRGRILDIWTARAPGETPHKAAGDDFASLMLTVDEAWDHFFGGRHALAWSIIEPILKKQPTLGPANQLVSALYVDAGLVQSAAQIVTAPSRKYAGTAWYRNQTSTLQQAGRYTEERAVLQQMKDEGVITLDGLSRLGAIAIAAGHLDEARHIFDHIVKTRPSLWRYALEFIDALIDHGLENEARTRLQKQWALTPGDSGVGRRLIHLDIKAGRVKSARRHLVALENAQTDAEQLEHLKKQLALETETPDLGPAIDQLVHVPCPPDVPAYVLHQHATVHVDHLGRGDRWIRRVVKLCSADTMNRFSTVDMSYVPGVQTLDVRIARRLRANEPTASPKRTEFGLSDPEARIFFDVHNERLSFAQSKADDIIEVVWRLKDYEPHPAFPGHYSELAYLQEDVPRHVSIVDFSTDPSIRVYRDVVTHGIALDKTKTRVVAKNVPAIRVETAMPGSTERYAHVHLSSLSSWNLVEETFEALLSDRADATADVRQLAFEIVPQGTPRPQVIAQLYTAVMQRIRYVGLEYGIHGFQPHRPMETWRRGYGDCKDKALLLFALLKAHGIRSQFTLVRTRPEGEIQPKPASWAVFNHAMLYLPDDDMFVDATVDQTALGDLPAGDEGASVLIVGRRGGITSVPVKAPEHHQSAWRFELGIDENGRLSGRAHWQATGSAATEARRALQDLNGRRHAADEYLSRQIPGARWQNIEHLRLDVDGQPFSMTGRIEQGRVYVDGTHRFIDVGLTPWRLVNRYAPSVRRNQDRVLAHGQKISLQYTLMTSRNEGFIEPDKVEDITPFGRFNRRIEHSNGQIKVFIEYDMFGGVIRTADHSKFRRWLARIDRHLSERLEVGRHDVD